MKNRSYKPILQKEMDKVLGLICEIGNPFFEIELPNGRIINVENDERYNEWEGLLNKIYDEVYDFGLKYKLKVP